MTKAILLATILLAACGPVIDPAFVFTEGFSYHYYGAFLDFHVFHLPDGTTTCWNNFRGTHFDISADGYAPLVTWFLLDKAAAYPLNRPYAPDDRNASIAFFVTGPVEHPRQDVIRDVITIPSPTGNGPVADAFVQAMRDFGTSSCQ